jgi:hypothetical protein
MRDTQFRKAAKVTEKDELHELFLIGNTHLETLGSTPPSASVAYSEQARPHKLSLSHATHTHTHTHTHTPTNTRTYLHVHTHTHTHMHT